MLYFPSGSVSKLCALPFPATVAKSSRSEITRSATRRDVLVCVQHGVCGLQCVPWSVSAQIRGGERWTQLWAEEPAGQSLPRIPSKQSYLSPNYAEWFTTINVVISFTHSCTYYIHPPTHSLNPHTHTHSTHPHTHTLQDLPSFVQNLRQFVNDVRYFAVLNAALPAGSISS